MWNYKRLPYVPELIKFCPDNPSTHRRIAAHRHKYELDVGPLRRGGEGTHRQVGRGWGRSVAADGALSRGGADVILLVVQETKAATPGVALGVGRRHPEMPPALDDDEIAVFDAALGQLLLVVFYYTVATVISPRQSNYMNMKPFKKLRHSIID